MASMRLAGGRLAGVGTLSWDQEGRILTVRYDPVTLTVEQIRQALEAVGFESMPVVNLNTGVSSERGLRE